MRLRKAHPCDSSVAGGCPQDAKMEIPDQDDLHAGGESPRRIPCA
jgi:hypothetical protein